MNPILAAALSVFLDSMMKEIGAYIQTQQARKDITDLEKNAETISGQQRIIRAQKWAIDALLNPDVHDFLLNLGGKLTDLPPGAGGAAVQ